MYGPPPPADGASGGAGWDGLASASGTGIAATAASMPSPVLSNMLRRSMCNTTNL
jgi:hypothetical protein